MVFLSVTLLTFVQFLWVLLWIGIALVVLSVLAGVYLYYRKSKTGEADDPLASDNEMAADPASEPGQAASAGEKAYQGLLWLKGKYEEDIQQADAKFYELREEFKKLEKKYIDLRVHSISLEQQLHAVNAMHAVNTMHSVSAIHSVDPIHSVPSKEVLYGTEIASSSIASASLNGSEPDAREQDHSPEHYHSQGKETQAITQAEWEALRDRLTAETLKVKDLESRLASSSQLLMKMYKELASSLQASNTFYKSKAHENRVKGLVKEFDAAAATTGERKISSWVESPAVDEDGQLEQLG